MDNSLTITNPLLLHAPTSVSSFNIDALTIYYALHILIQSMHPLEGHFLLYFQEKTHHVEYILIGDMIFIVPKMLSHTDDHLREVPTLIRNAQFGNRSIILLRDLG